MTLVPLPDLFQPISSLVVSLPCGPRSSSSTSRQLPPSVHGDDSRPGTGRARAWPGLTGPASAVRRHHGRAWPASVAPGQCGSGGSTGGGELLLHLRRSGGSGRQSGGSSWRGRACMACSRTGQSSRSWNGTRGRERRGCYPVAYIAHASNDPGRPQHVAGGPAAREAHGQRGACGPAAHGARSSRRRAKLVAQAAAAMVAASTRVHGARRAQADRHKTGN
jgi:hypothetical protein